MFLGKNIFINQLCVFLKFEFTKKIEDGTYTKDKHLNKTVDCCFNKTSKNTINGYNK